MPGQCVNRTVSLPSKSSKLEHGGEKLRCKGDSAHNYRPQGHWLSEGFTEKVSFELGCEGGAEFGDIEKGGSIFGGRGGTIWDKCKESLHSPSLTECRHVQERESVGDEPEDRRFWTWSCHMSWKEAFWAGDCVVTGVYWQSSFSTMTHSPWESQPHGAGRAGAVHPPGRLDNRGSRANSSVWDSSFCTIWAQVPSAGGRGGGGGPSSTDPLLNSFWGEAREGPRHLDGSQRFFSFILIFRILRQLGGYGSKQRDDSASCERAAAFWKRYFCFNASLFSAIEVAHPDCLVFLMFNCARTEGQGQLPGLGGQTASELESWPSSILAERTWTKWHPLWACIYLRLQYCNSWGFAFV